MIATFDASVLDAYAITAISIAAAFDAIVVHTKFIAIAVTVCLTFNTRVITRIEHAIHVHVTRANGIAKERAIILLEAVNLDTCLIGTDVQLSWAVRNSFTPDRALTEEALFVQANAVIIAVTLRWWLLVTCTRAA